MQFTKPQFQTPDRFLAIIIQHISLSTFKQKYYILLSNHLANYFAVYLIKDRKLLECSEIGHVQYYLHLHYRPRWSQYSDLLLFGMFWIFYSRSILRNSLWVYHISVRSSIDVEEFRNTSLNFYVPVQFTSRAAVLRPPIIFRTRTGTQPVIKLNFSVTNVSSFVPCYTWPALHDTWQTFQIVGVSIFESS